MHKRGRHAAGADAIEQQRFHGEVVVVFRAVLHADDHRCPVDLRLPGEVIALSCPRAQNEARDREVIRQFLAEQWFEILVRFTTPLGAVKRGRTITFPIVNAGPAHDAGGLLFHQEATMAPTMFCMTPLKTDAAAASGRVGKCCLARAAAMPPFCMPTSMLTVRATDSG